MCFFRATLYLHSISHVSNKKKFHTYIYDLFESFFHPQFNLRLSVNKKGRVDGMKMSFRENNIKDNEIQFHELIYIK